MKNVYGAPSTGIPLSEREEQLLHDERVGYSRELMTELLLELTPDELRLRGKPSSAVSYDFKAFRNENNIFVAGNNVHVLRHLRYDRHEPHTHDYFEIFCQLFGEGIAELSGERYGLEVGQICLLAPGTPHRLIAPSDGSVILKVILRESDFDNYSRQLLRSDSLLSGFFRTSLHGGSGFLMFETAGNDEIRELLLKLRYYEVRRALTDYLMKESLLMQLFCLLMSEHIDSVQTSVDGLRGSRRNFTSREIISTV